MIPKKLLIYGYGNDVHCDPNEVVLLHVLLFGIKLLYKVIFKKIICTDFTTVPVVERVTERV